MKWNRERLIYLHPTFWFLFVLSIMTGMFYHLSIVFVIVTWHELGHFFMAKYFNWQVRKITLWMFGGVMETDEHLNKPLLQQIFFTIDRKSTRLNSSHVSNSYDVICLKKKNT